MWTRQEVIRIFSDHIMKRNQQASAKVRTWWMGKWSSYLSLERFLWMEHGIKVKLCMVVWEVRNWTWKWLFVETVILTRNDYLLGSFPIMGFNYSELPCVVLQSRLSQFWRHQKNSPRWYLATIEAIHQLLTEIREHCAEVTQSSNSFSSEYDNLLFFFRYMYHLIHSFYNHNELLSFRRPVNLWKLLWK